MGTQIQSQTDSARCGSIKLKLAWRAICYGTVSYCKSSHHTTLDRIALIISTIHHQIWITDLLKSGAARLLVEEHGVCPDRDFQTDANL